MKKVIRNIFILSAVLLIVFITLKFLSKNKIIIPTLSSDYMNIEQINSNNAIVLEKSNKHIIMGKNMENQIHPASMTKVMTAIVALEKITNLKDTTEITPDVIDYCLKNGLSTSGFQVGDEPRIIDLLYGLLLESGGESGITLANYISGSEDEFSELMNEKARKLGMENTNFSNSTGITNPSNLSTPKDIAIMFDHALKNKNFRKIIMSTEYKVSSSKDHIIQNYLFLKRDSLDIDKHYIKCGKTGYTEAAGLCLVSYGKVNNKEYIVVTAGANGNAYTEQFNLIDTEKIYQQLEILNN